MLRIVVDSGCDIDEAVKNKTGINLEKVPLNLQVESEHFVDDSDLDVDYYIKAMENSKTIPKTAAPAPSLYMQKYQGEESIFAVTLSSKMSGSYNSAMLAKDMYLSEIGNKFIHVFDSFSASVAEMLIALKVHEFSKKHLSDRQIVENVNNFISGMRTYFILDRFDNLVKTGRMNQYIAKLGSILSIKPICMATPEGEIALADKARGYERAVVKLVDIIEGLNFDFENRILGISHVKSPEKANILKNEIVKRIKFKDIIIVEAGGLCSTYAQKLGVILAF